MRLLTAIGITLLAAASTVNAQYQIDWYSINSGGVVNGSAASYRLSATAGQTVAGFVGSTSVLHWAGFWSGSVPTPQLIADIGLLKNIPDGAFVSIAGKLASSAASDFGQFFYVQESDRSNGIRVEAPSGSLTGVNRGAVVNVIGTLSKTSSDERVITGPVVVVVASGNAPVPLGMNNRTIGGDSFPGMPGVSGASGVNNVGLLVRTWGRVTSAGSGYIEVNDGSGPVRIDTSTLVSPPSVGQWIKVVGISSLYKSASERLRLLLPRNGSDISAP